jgi:hypothetical protein
VNLASCRSLPRTPENGVWYRLIDPKQQFECLYFADDVLPAQFEVGAMLGDPSPGGHLPHPRHSHFVTLNVLIILRDVIDLTDEATAQVPLATTVQELTGDWKAYEIRNSSTPVSGPRGIAPTQALGKALSATGVEGFRSISARVPYHKTLTVFPSNLKSGSSLSFSDPSGRVIHTISP